ncbi:MAG: hypothetical protein ACOCP8_05705 [archaeon]
MTHQIGTPWYEIYIKYNKNIPKNMIIPDEKIEEHFRKSLHDHKYK